jgi:hypothetical protein
MNLKKKEMTKKKKRIIFFFDKDMKRKEKKIMCVFIPNLAKQNCVFTLEIRAHNPYMA